MFHLNAQIYIYSMLGFTIHAIDINIFLCYFLNITALFLRDI